MDNVEVANEDQQQQTYAGSSKSEEKTTVDGCSISAKSARSPAAVAPSKISNTHKEIGESSWNYRKIRKNDYYDVKPPYTNDDEPCNCTLPPPGATSIIHSMLIHLLYLYY